MKAVKFSSVPNRGALTEPVLASLAKSKLGSLWFPPPLIKIPTRQSLQRILVPGKKYAKLEGVSLARAGTHG